MRVRWITVIGVAFALAVMGKVAQHAFLTPVVSEPSSEMSARHGQDLRKLRSAIEPGQTAGAGSRSGYEAITQHNLFRPLGWEPPKRTTTTLIPEHTPPVEPEPASQPQPHYLTLTGIAQDGAESIAILEDSDRSATYFLRAGEKLKQGRIRAIHPEHIVMIQDEAEAEVALGKSVPYNGNGHLLFGSLQRHSPIPRADADRLTMDSGAEDTQEATSLLEQMRARRRKELARP